MNKYINIKKIVRNSEILLFLYNIIQKYIYRKTYKKYVNINKHTEIFNIDTLSKDIPYFPHSKHKDSNLYGHYCTLKYYTGLKCFDFLIEHGLYIGSHVPYATYLKTTKRIITFSKNREDHLRSAGIDKPILTIGPYIHYAETLLSDLELRELKASHGKILTVFPSHSSEGYNVNTNHKKFLQVIENISEDFDSVFICVYFKDIQENKHIKEYVNRGYKIVTAGHRYELNFLSRLKAIIELSDYTLSNTVGTHTGYCIYLNKPHYIFNQTVSYTDEKGKVSKEYRTEYEIEQMVSEQVEIANAFKEYKPKITKTQRKVVEKYWGISEIKSKEELRSQILKE